VTENRQSFLAFCDWRHLDPNDSATVRHIGGTASAVDYCKEFGFAQDNDVVVLPSRKPLTQILNNLQPTKPKGKKK
jgi:hypothetical protein